MTLEFEEQPVSECELKWQAKAVLLADKCKIDISVIRDSGTYQLWPSSKAGCGIFCAKYVEVV